MAPRGYAQVYGRHNFWRAGSDPTADGYATFGEHAQSLVPLLRVMLFWLGSTARRTRTVTRKARSSAAFGFLLLLMLLFS